MAPSLGTVSLDVRGLSTEHGIYSQPSMVTNEKPTMMKLVPDMKVNLEEHLDQLRMALDGITHNPTKSNFAANSRHEALELLSRLTVLREITRTVNAIRQIGRFM